MQVPSIVLLVLVLISSVIHLYFCWVENEKLRKITKAFPIVFLTAAIFIAVPKYPLIWLFPLLSLFGDIALLFKKKSIFFFLIAFIFFLGAHICNFNELTIMLVRSDTTIPTLSYVIFGISSVLIVVFIFPITRKVAGKYGIIANIYFPVLIVVGATSLLVTAAYANSYQGLLVALGYVFFIFSDAFLIYSNFFKDVKRHDFYVMSTYIIAEVLISVGLTMLVTMGIAI